MRVVRYDAQERVDIPDITAMSFLVLGEFRRTVRTVILGSESNFVGRGFKVEPQAVPDATVLIKLDPGGGGPLGFFIGGENTGSVEFGVIAGDKNSVGQLEGNATTTLDFTGQPAAIYTVQVRFTYADGENDNRVFWNPVLNTEFTAATDTRFLPTWEARFSGAPSAEWVDLATVDWDGVGPIIAADITDTRNHVFEGQSPFQKTTYAAAGGLPDFTRTATRDDGSIGLQGLYEVVRALARQIQDLKGHDQAGFINWFGRIVNPIALPATHPKSIRSIDTVTYTVGDGITEFGDFFGVNGLDDCLAHIITNAASLPEHVVIVLKSRQTAAFSFNLGGAAGTARTITGTYVEIIGATGGLNDGTNDEGQIQINADNFAAGTTCLTVSGTGSGLTLKNIQVLSPTPLNLTLFSTSRNFRMFHCNIRGPVASATTGYAFRVANPANLRIENCDIEGRVRITGNATSSEGGRIENTNFNGCGIELTDGAAAIAQNVTFEQCRFSGLDFDNTEGVIDGRGASNIRFIDCRLESDDEDHDIVRLGLSGTVASEHWLFRGCTFVVENGGVHAVNGGVNGLFGTGWCVFASNTDATDQMRDVLFEGCIFAGNSDGTIDSGGIFVRQGRRFRVIDCTFRDFKAAVGAGSRIRLIELNGGGAGLVSGHAVRGCSFSDWRTGPSTRIETALLLNGIAHTVVSDCLFDGRLSDGTDAGDRPGGGAIAMATSTFGTIHQNTFHRWDPGVTSSPGGCIFPSAGPNTHFTFAGNVFNECGYAPIDMAAIVGEAARSTYVGNVFKNATATASDTPFGITSDGVECTFIGNVGDFTDAGGGDPALIALGSGATDNCVYGNSGGDATIEKSGVLAVSGIPAVVPVAGGADEFNRNNVKDYT